MSDPKIMTVAELSLEQLRDEVFFWRTNAACWLWHVNHDATEAAKRGDRETFERLTGWNGDVKELSGVLGEALRNGYLERCEPCGEPLRHGDLVIRYEDVGDTHAACAGVPEDQRFVGGQLAIDPAEIDHDALEPGEDPPTHATVYAHEPLYTEDKIAEIQREGAALMADDAWSKLTGEGAFVVVDTRYLLDDFSDEVLPCESTLQGWADWLAKDADDDGFTGPERPVPDGATFKAHVMEFADDLVVTFDAGAWSYMEDAVPAGVTFQALRFGEGLGWGPDQIGGSIDELVEQLEPGDQGDQAYIALGRDAPAVMVRFERTAEGPRCVVEGPVQ